MGIANLSDHTLSQCYTYDVNQNNITIYLKGLTHHGVFYFDISAQVNKDLGVLSKKEVVTHVVSLLATPEIYNDFQSRFENNEIYLTTKEEALFFMDLDLLLEAKKFKIGNIIGRYNDKLIYETIQIKNKVFEYLGIALPKDILSNKYNLVDNKLIICYNEIAYQLKGDVAS